mgnify:FL=1
MDPSTERLVKDILRVLRCHFWIPELNTKEMYERLHDDHDGTFKGRIGVQFGQDCDAWVAIDGRTFLRFRTPLGGGCSPRVRNALMILALAIKLDNEKNLQQIPD